MPDQFGRFVARFLANTGQQLGLGCHREVVTLPLNMLCRTGLRAGRLR